MRQKTQKEEHPLTERELDNMAGIIILGEGIKHFHDRMVADRQHEEMMDEKLYDWAELRKYILHKF